MALAATLVLFALLIAGCGGGDEPSDSAGVAADQEMGPSEGDSADGFPGGGFTGPAPQPDELEPEVDGADPEAVEVISAWTNTLSAGDEQGAAEYFAIPSIAENGPQLIEITSLEEATLFNRTLPCGARLIGAETTGDFTTARFRLYDRPGGGCGPGAGATAATSFVIEDGLITEWRRVSTPEESRRTPRPVT